MTAYLYLSAAVALAIADPSQRADALVMQSLLVDETCMERHRDVLDGLVREYGVSAVPTLEALLREDMVFWNNRGMNLDEPAKLSAVRVARLTAVLHHLAVLGYRDPQHLVRDVRDRFRDHPVLCEHARSVITEARAILATE